ncbi:biopolymer transporter ExbD [Chitinophaga sp. Cy-1792]|uniref:ExbD/TolR family protein n=1 Tax=Chitinophaga sp. Cy-1792 TaxID=2608339 RepID=UPI0014222A60|nr:biopolymer transporter ExbD [Chitinophaga sp. Cy-1792]NIG52181.1 biopolymer transporter ExbD [Chitinophaga sp. Cy-1792]
MAEINTSGNNKHQGKRRSIKKSTRVDMTPMVDLGFLLITFFMLTTTMAQPKTMDLIMPRTDGEPSPLPESKALTVVLGPDNKIAWYEGTPPASNTQPELHYTSYGNKGLRDVIISKKDQVQQQFHKNDLMVLIKADKSANYKNLIDVMDEMLINKIDRYAVVDITPEEQAYFN